MKISRLGAINNLLEGYVEAYKADDRFRCILFAFPLLEHLIIWGDLNGNKGYIGQTNYDGHDDRLIVLLDRIAQENGYEDAYSSNIRKLWFMTRNMVIHGKLRSDYEIEFRDHVFKGTKSTDKEDQLEIEDSFHSAMAEVVYNQYCHSIGSSVSKSYADLRKICVENRYHNFGVFGK